MDKPGIIESTKRLLHHHAATWMTDAVRLKRHPGMRRPQVWINGAAATVTLEQCYLVIFKARDDGRFASTT